LEATLGLGKSYIDHDSRMEARETAGALRTRGTDTSGTYPLPFEYKFFLCKEFTSTGKGEHVIKPEMVAGF